MKQKLLLSIFAILLLAQKMYARVVMRQAITRSGRVITVSEVAKRELCGHVKAPAEKVSVIHLGVDKKRYIAKNDGAGVAIKKKYRFMKK